MKSEKIFHYQLTELIKKNNVSNKKSKFWFPMNFVIFGVRNFFEPVLPFSQKLLNELRQFSMICSMYDVITVVTSQHTLLSEQLYNSYCHFFVLVHVKPVRKIIIDERNGEQSSIFCSKYELDKIYCEIKTSNLTIIKVIGQIEFRG